MVRKRKGLTLRLQGSRRLCPSCPSCPRVPSCSSTKPYIESPSKSTECFCVITLRCKPEKTLAHFSSRHSQQHGHGKIVDFMWFKFLRCQVLRSDLHLINFCAKRCLDHLSAGRSLRRRRRLSNSTLLSACIDAFSFRNSVLGVFLPFLSLSSRWDDLG